MPSPRSSANTSFSLILSDNKELLRAYVVQLAPQSFVAWSPYFFRILRRQARQLRSHLDLADDVISTLYDPRGQMNISAIYSLANITDWGLFQLYGGRAIMPTAEAAILAAERGSARLITALKGRYRQSVIEPLRTEEATAYYRHLLSCSFTAAMLGQAVRRAAPAMTSTDGVGQLVAADAQEQIETVVAGMEDAPFATQTILDPFSALEIHTTLQRTATELSRFASMVKGSEGVNISISPGVLMTPLSGVVQQDSRSTGISHVDRRSALEEQARELSASRSQGVTDWERQQQTRETFQGHTDTSYAAGAHIAENISEREDARVALERDYAERYSMSRSYNGVEEGVLRDTTTRAAEQDGTRNSQTQEQGALNAHDSIDEATAGYRSGSGTRNDNMNYSYGESGTFGSSRTYGGTYHEATTDRFGGGTIDLTQSTFNGQTAEQGGQQIQEDFTRSGEQNTTEQTFQDTQRANETIQSQQGVNIFGMLAAGQSQEAQHIGDIVQSSADQQTNASGDATTNRTVDGEQAQQGGRTTLESNMQQGFQGNEHNRTWNGSEYSGGSEWRSGGGSRNTSTAYSYGESYGDQHHTDRDSARTWDSGVAQQMGWQQAVTERAQGEQSFIKSYGGAYSEAGTREGHLSQQDHIISERDIARTTDRQETGWRSEDVSGNMARQQAETGDMTMRQAVVGTAEGYANSQVALQSGETGSFAGSSVATTRGYMGPGGSGMFLGLSISRQTLDAQREILANLLLQQRDRLLAGLDTGFFLSQTVLMAPNAQTLERLIGAALAAWREEQVVVPLTALRGDEGLWTSSLAFSIDPRREDGPFDTFAFAQGLTSNEIAPLVHPVRIEGKGGVSTTLRAWPDVLGLGRSAGELEWGLQISPSTSETTDLVYRVGRGRLMHLLVVGSSGSGKSNSALWIAAQIINRIREDDQGRPLPVPQSGPMRVLVPDGRPAMGITVFDPTGEWRRMAQFVLNDEFRFYSLTDPDFHNLGFNPVAIPSDFIEPKDWIAVFSKRWALAYATGATGVSLMRRALRELYEAHDVFDHPENSQQLTLGDLYTVAQGVFEEMQRNRQIDNISPGILKRILDKMEEFQPGGLHFETFGQPGSANVEQWLWPYGVTILEGDFGDDEMLKSFIMGLLGMATYRHAASKYKDQIKQQGTLAVRRHLLVFEEAHVVMASGDKTEAESAVEKTAGLWDDLADRGRKFGLYLMVLAQHWEGLPEGILGSAKLVVAQGVNTLKDAEAAVAALGIRPGRSAIDDVTQVLDRLLDMPVGVGICKLKRLPKQQEDEQKPVAVLFPDISMVEPPTDGQLDYLLTHAVRLAQQQRASWQLVKGAFLPQPATLVK